MGARADLAVLVGLSLATFAAGCSLDREPRQGDARHGAAAGAGDAAGGGAAGTATAGNTATPCDASDCDGGKAARDGLLPSGLCEPTGVFAMRVTVDVAWGGRNTALGYITDNGRGRITVDARLSIDHANPDGTFTATLLPCGVALPPFFSSILCEVYQPIFPAPLWESATMRVLTTQGRYDCTAPGCLMHLGASTVLVGIDLADPNAPWPTPLQTQTVGCPAGQGAACFLDHDGDQVAGVTIDFTTTQVNPANQVCAGGYPFRNPPLTGDAFAIASGAAPRAATLQLGARVQLLGQGSLSADCAQRLGPGAAYSFDSRAISCSTQAGARCSDAEQQFMDANLPVYYVLDKSVVPDAALNLPDKSASTGTSFSVTRLGDVGAAVSCTDVRAAKF